MNATDTLKSHIKTKNFKRLYVFYGGDDYMKNTYAKRILDACLPKDQRDMNLDIYDQLNYKADDVFDKCSLAPFLADKRVVIIKDSKLFGGGEKREKGTEPVKSRKLLTETEKTEQYLRNIPDSTIVIFIESKADKRLALYKTAAKTGECIEFEPLKDADLIKWIIYEAKAEGRVISAADAAYFAHITPKDMGIQHKELQKLAAYSESVITKKDITEITTKSLEANIFALVDAIGGKNLKTALAVYDNLLFMKESPFMILSMMARQFRMILGCMDHKAKGASAGDIAAALGIYDFAVRGLLSQAKNFPRESVKQALRDCLNADADIKKGRITDALAVEMLIIKYAG